MRISDWSSDVCSSDLGALATGMPARSSVAAFPKSIVHVPPNSQVRISWMPHPCLASSCATSGGRRKNCSPIGRRRPEPPCRRAACIAARRSEEHTSELQSLMRISYAVFCLTKQITQNTVCHYTLLSPFHLHYIVTLITYFP